VDHPSEISLAEIDVRDLSRGLIDAATYLGLDPSWYRSSRP